MKFIKIKKYNINLENVIWIGQSDNYISFNFIGAAFISFNDGTMGDGIRLSTLEFSELKEKVNDLNKGESITWKY